MLARGSCRARGGAALAALLCMSTLHAAEPPQVRTYRLDLEKLDGIEHGNTAVVKGEAGTSPHRFLVDGINMNMPVAVLVRPVRENDEVAAGDEVKPELRPVVIKASEYGASSSGRVGSPVM